VGYRCAGSGSEVQNFAAGSHVDVVDTSQNTSSQLGPERIPHTVLSAASLLAVLGCGGSHADALLTVDGLAWGQVLGDEKVFLSTCYENA
jgi:hypothetical protein